MNTQPLLFRVIFNHININYCGSGEFIACAHGYCRLIAFLPLYNQQIRHYALAENKAILVNIKIPRKIAQG
ncbi:hypothetical protein [Beggiatoa leptomitoformis]|uniref:Uncharacterized protein n=1 Tax=Beggiatoa leptomitoformis TaxID=288004 RepID=A0A650GCG0_9GAMM|nr:hypothetical protein [Beggiatoa leptomitoformis]QGX03638.1 hypothetical protein AL038_18810 [Beggiatoa leptomitoformis]QGX04075.1 hypothetical protein BLE401_18585 [Beggiatoa leptomitoformis]